ncbi:MAG: menaquinone biosynthesis decarboxylase [Chitinophagaceae bacterium]
MYNNLKQFISVLEKSGELIRISELVSPHLEMAEITDRISKSGQGGKALLFENTGFEFPVLINALGSYTRICLALGVNQLDQVSHEIESLFHELSKPKENIFDQLSLLPKLRQFASWMPKVISAKGKCQEVVQKTPDLFKLPVMTCWPRDGGPFITLPIIHTKDPLTHIRNVGMYRMQVFTKDMTGMHWHKHKVSAKHFNEYKKLGKRMPVAVALGGDPVYTYAATAPLPENVDEYMLAGFLRKKRVELVKCLSQPDIEVPQDADFIIEGYVDPGEELIWEGPFGDHTGYYSLPDWYPRFHVTCITHRKDAIYPSTIVGIPPQEDAWIGKATERIFIAPIKMTLVPEIIDMEMPVEGVFHNLVIVKIKKEFAGQAQKVMNAMWGAGQMMFNKILIIVDEQGPIHHYRELAKYVLDHLNPKTDIYFSQGPMDVLDHSCSKLGFGGKMCIDGTRKLEEEMSYSISREDTVIALQVEKIFSQFPEIKDINSCLLEWGIPCVLIAVKKTRKNQIQELHQQLFALPEFQGIKMILFLDDSVPIQDFPDALWRFCNNLDPQRDHFLASLPSCYASSPEHLQFGISLDGTRKTKDLDNFQREWPNIIVGDAQTIQSVDKKWESLGLGDFLPSPSLKYQGQLYGQEAAVPD